MAPKLEAIPTIDHKTATLALSPLLISEVSFQLVPGNDARIQDSLESSSLVRILKASEPFPHISANDLSPNQPGRLIFIGDIHGCLDEFEELLTKLNYLKDTDILVLLGDLVGKGPKPHGVVRKAIELKALCVRGNHDDLVIRWYNYLHSSSQIDPNSLNEADFPFKDFRLKGQHVEIAKIMSQQEYEYLVNLPAIIRLKGNNETLIAVHAGLDPQKLLSEQESSVVIRMRNIKKSGKPVEKKKDGGKSWSSVWELTKDSVDKDGNASNLKPSSDLAQISKIFYGHDAFRGLNLKKYTKGLDSGCVYGRKLTAYVYPQNEIVQVDCKGYAPVQPNK
ncbi:hypothetical protein BB560_005271 [Smittium megazygosporum]|uniref:Calcineurin-like phosphoesterase domain-containing protein n=1 Tax=Smittium megazygosporum TaxID=133381 RepID=A0A2T9Z6Y2_9FUNG|nr:hypothetical protein BB560_005271 [Smittium megazygosporum]